MTWMLCQTVGFPGERGNVHSAIGTTDDNRPFQMRGVDSSDIAMSATHQHCTSQLWKETPGCEQSEVHERQTSKSLVNVGRCPLASKDCGLCMRTRRVFWQAQRHQHPVTCVLSVRKTGVFEVDRPERVDLSRAQASVHHTSLRGA